jgi:hypothetical protein
MNLPYLIDEDVSHALPHVPHQVHIIPTSPLPTCHDPSLSIPPTTPKSLHGERQIQTPNFSPSSPCPRSSAKTPNLTPVPSLSQVLITQSQVIYLYLARKCNMMGANTAENLKCEQALAVVYDIR